MHLLFKVLAIFSVTQAVIAELSSSHNGMENNHRQKRDMYSSNYQATSPSSNYTYSGATPSASYPSYTSGTSNYPSSGGYNYNYNQNQQTCDCTMNCYFDTKPCTDVDHPTGCIVQDCTETDTRLIGYTCFCTSTWFPGGCVYPFDGTTRCTDASTPECSCNGISKSPDDCSLDYCQAGEQPTCTTRCICNLDDPTKQPCGCVTILLSGVETAQSTNSIASQFQALISDKQKGNPFHSIQSTSSFGSKGNQAELKALEALLAGEK